MAINQSSTLKMKDDIMFKAFFSKKGNEKFLKSFLSAILGENIHIKNIIHDARLQQLTREDKYGILDLDVELENGEYINIEMQMDNRGNMEKRNTFYAGKKISEQLRSRAAYDELKKVIIISILNYNFIELPEYITKTIRVANKHRNYEINNNVEYYYIELPKFRKQNPDMKIPINQWLAFIDMERRDLLDMAEKESKIIKEANENYNVLTGDAELKRLEEVRMFAYMEEQAALSTARKEGISEGKSKGKKENQIEIAKKLLARNLDIKEISKITELSIEELKQLTKE